MAMAMAWKPGTMYLVGGKPHKQGYQSSITNSKYINYSCHSKLLTLPNLGRYIHMYLDSLNIVPSVTPPIWPWFCKANPISIHFEGI